MFAARRLRATSRQFPCGSTGTRNRDYAVWDSRFTLKATRQIAAVDPVPPVGFGAIERAIGFRRQRIQIAVVAVR